MAKDVESRFWDKVLLGGECWEWVAGKNRDGYGLFRSSLHRTTIAHRISWSLLHGEPPPELKVLHKCDNPACVRPSHLFLGTDLDNVRDAIEKGRFVYPESRKGSLHPGHGEKHWKAKLTKEQVEDIRRRHAPWHPTDSTAAMAREFGVHETTIWAAIRRKSWARS